MTNRVGKSCKQLSNGLFNELLAIGNWHDSAKYFYKT